MEENNLGEILKKKRQELSLKTSQLHAKLNVREKDLEALENEDWHQLNKNLYISGLIISYSKLLKIDEKIINDKIKNLSLKSNIENKKHNLINIGEHVELSADRKMFYQFLIISFALFFTFLTIYNSIENKKNLVTSDFIIKKFQKINETQN